MDLFPLPQQYIASRIVDDHCVRGYQQVKKFLLSQLLRLYHWKVVYILARARIPTSRTHYHRRWMSSDKTRGEDGPPGPARELAASRTFVTVCAGDATASPRYFRSAHMAPTTERGIYRRKHVNRVTRCNFRNPSRAARLSSPNCRDAICRLASECIEKLTRKSIHLLSIIFE